MTKRRRRGLGGILERDVMRDVLSDILDLRSRGVPLSDDVEVCGEIVDVRLEGSDDRPDGELDYVTVTCSECSKMVQFGFKGPQVRDWRHEAPPCATWLEANTGRQLQYRLATFAAAQRARANN